ncbi:MAG: hypothetical protein JNK90_02930 [Planctomycetaceae bacterium]|nr:hypothetical protein [Planctomycetaceae bacterium]
MDKSLQIKKQLVSEHQETRELGLKSFLEAPEASEFFVKIAELIRKEVMISGVPSADVVNSSLHNSLVQLVPELMRLSDSLVQTIKRYEPERDGSLWDFLYLQRLEPLLQSIHVKSYYETDSVRLWTLGQKVFGSYPKTVEFFENIKQVVKEQVEHSRSSDQAIEGKVFFNELYDKALDSLKADRSLADFLRKYDPIQGFTLWDFILNGRIKPGLMGWARDEREKPKPRTWDSSEDLGAQQTSHVHFDVDEDDRSFESRLMSFYSTLGENHRELLLLDFWGLLSAVQRDLLREKIVERGIANRVQQRRAETKSAMYAEITAAISQGELKLEIDRRDQGIKYLEVEGAAAAHVCAARIQGEKKKSFAIQFEKKNGLQGLHKEGGRGDLRLGSKSLPAAWFRWPKKVLYEMCRIASEKKISKDSFEKEYYTYFPLSVIYPDYRPRTGAPKLINESLWILKEFGVLCQNQAFHYKAYLSKQKDLESLKQSLGMADKDIANILSLSVANVRQMRHRQRQDMQENVDVSQLGYRSGTIQESPSAVDVVCIDYKD